MWIMLNTGPVSVVAHREKPEMLLVRARSREHLVAAIGSDREEEIFEMTSADYRWRVELSKTAWADKVAEHIQSMNYGNFKSSVKDSKLHDLYLSIWSLIEKAYRTRD